MSYSGDDLHKELGRLYMEARVRGDREKEYQEHISRLEEEVQVLRNALKESETMVRILEARK
jgi:hypothetical protein